MVHQMEILGEIASRCQIGQGLTKDQMVWLGAVLRRIVSGRYRTMGEAFGLRPARGGMPCWLEYAVRRRNHALSQLAQIHFAGLRASNQATRIGTLSLRYAASAWMFDQRRETMPEEYVGTVREWLWRAFSSGARMPIAHRQLRAILSVASVTPVENRLVFGGLQGVTGPCAKPDPRRSRLISSGDEVVT